MKSRRPPKRGLLERSDGTRLPPFEAPVSSIRSYARTVRQRRAGKASSEAAKLPPRDAVESVRQRLIRMVDLELAFEERKRNGKRDLERIRQLGRAAREAAALPELNAPRPRAPDAQPGGNRTPTGGLAGAILKAHRTTGPRVETQAAQEAHKQRGLRRQGTHGAKRSTRPRSTARTNEQTRPVSSRASRVGLSSDVVLG
jgi:hypothetical protein